MKLVRLKAARPNYIRVLSREDLDRHNIPTPAEVLVWDDANDHILEMSDRASDSLVAAFSSEFEIIGDADDESESDDSQLDLFSAAGAEDDEDDESDDDDELVD